MNKAIAFIVGAWVMYCGMIGSYDGAVVILIVYVLTVLMKPFSNDKQKKNVGTGDTNAQK